MRDAVGTRWAVSVNGASEAASFKSANLAEILPESFPWRVPGALMQVHGLQSKPEMIERVVSLVRQEADKWIVQFYRSN